MATTLHEITNIVVLLFASILQFQFIQWYTVVYMSVVCRGSSRKLDVTVTSLCCGEVDVQVQSEEKHSLKKSTHCDIIKNVSETVSEKNDKVKNSPKVIN